MNTTTRLAWRAALALSLMVGFYGLALLMIALLIGFPVLLWHVAKGFAIKAGFFCLVACFVILKAIVPRRDRFEPPGPSLDPIDQPRLFAEIHAVADAMRQEMPADVYLMADVNAGVSHRGGFMGFGSRRVMVLGLPLLQTLRIPELRAVIAHEFGHFHGGDVAIGPWIYKTRSALVRTVTELREHSEALTAPFEWYGNLFFRVTHAVSRHQEVLADRVAADVAGARALAGGLRAVEGAGLAFVPYWKLAVEPLLSQGFVPPLAAGFEAFVRTPWVAEKVAESLTDDTLLRQRSAYDTHPALPDRLAALGMEASSAERVEGALSVSLLDDLPGLEARLAAVVRPGNVAGDETSLNLGKDRPSLLPVAWAEVGRTVWLPNWERFARNMAKHLAGTTPALLPELDWLALGRRILGRVAEAEEPLEVADSAVGSALAVILARVGFTVESHPAAIPALVGQGERIEIFRIREQLATGASAPGEWRAFCERAGIANVDLGSVVA